MELFRLLGTIAIDNTEANSAINETTDNANNASDEVSSAFEKIGGVAGRIATGLSVAATAIGGAFIATIESTREYRKEMGLLESAYLTAGHSSEDAKNTYSELNAVMGDTGAAVEAAQHLAKIANNEKDLSTWTNIATGVYSEFGAAIPIESLAEASLETQKSGVLTGALVDALVWAGHSEEEFQEKLDACTTEQERQELIMNTLNDTYKDASDQYKETNKDVLEAEKANERLADAMAEIGAVGEPILTRIKDAIAGMIETAVPKIESFIEKLQDVVKWVKENESTVQTWIGVILGASVAIGTFLLILNWGSIMTAAANAINVVRTAILGMNAAMLANPVGLIVALIAGLVVAFIYLWNNVDGFKKFWIDAWKMIQEKAGQAKDWIVEKWNNIGEWFSEKFSKIKQAGQDVTDKVKQFFSDSWSRITGVFSSIGSWFGDKFRNAWSQIKSAFSNWGSFFSELWGKVKNKFGDIGTKIGESISSAVKGAMNKALGKIETSINKGIRLINKAIGLANKLGFSVGTVGEISLPRLATGTVVTRATPAIIGEDGAEAVVPLERNTQWIDKVSARFNQNLSTNIDNEMFNVKLNRIVELLEQLLTRNIYLDTGVLVGELIEPVNVEMGRQFINSKRNNV